MIIRRLKIIRLPETEESRRQHEVEWTTGMIPMRGFKGVWTCWTGLAQRVLQARISLKSGSVLVGWQPATRGAGPTGHLNF